MSSRPRDARTIRLPLLDRLIDDDPDHQERDPLRSRAELIRTFHRAVVRDLSRLLNTRRRPIELPAALEELSCSSLDYGVPDFTGANLASQDAREELRRKIEDVIQRYEPRLDRVRVTLPKRERDDRTLRLRIDAVLNADPIREPVVFDSVVEPLSGGVALEGRLDD